jgi:peptide-methionine (S)-S-oxide reductase
MFNRFSILLFSFILLEISCQSNENKTINNMNSIQVNGTENNDTATLGAGCFWCVEAVFKELKGVISVSPGYAGGSVKNPSYHEVCTGSTGHAEVCQIIYDPAIIKFDDILEVFWQTHDPTTLNKQGNDIGTQYRSAIFYHNTKQREIAEYYKKKLNDSGAFTSPLTTEIVPFTAYYPAEDYHKDYYQKNPNQPYCTFVILPKLEKFHKAFKSKLKN